MDKRRHFTYPSLGKQTLQYGLFCYQIKYQCSANYQLPMSIFFFMSTSLKTLRRHDNKYSFISKSKEQGIWVKSEKAGDWRVVVCFCIALLCCRREEPNSSHYTDRKSTLLEFYDKKIPNANHVLHVLLDKTFLHALIQNNMPKLLPTWGNIWIEKQKLLFDAHKK